MKLPADGAHPLGSLLTKNDAALMQAVAERADSDLSHELAALKEPELERAAAQLSARLVRSRKKRLRLVLHEACCITLLHMAYAGRGREGRFTRKLAELGYDRRRAYEYMDVWKAFKSFAASGKFLDRWCFESAKTIARAGEVVQAKAFQMAEEGAYINIKLANRLVAEAKNDPAPRSASGAKSAALTTRPEPVLDEPFHDARSDILIRTTIGKQPTLAELRQAFTAALNHVGGKLKAAESA